MIKSVKLRLAIVLATIVLALIYLFPTMGGTVPDWWGKIFPTEKYYADYREEERPSVSPGIKERYCSQRCIPFFFNSDHSENHD